MASDDFPESVDAIILGTGLPEAIISAALSRIGKKVLHLDRNQHYGSNWATHNLNGLIEWAEEEIKKEIKLKHDDNENESVANAPSIDVAMEDNTFSNIKVLQFLKSTLDKGCTDFSSVGEPEAINMDRMDADSTSPPGDTTETQKMDAEDHMPHITAGVVVRENDEATDVEQSATDSNEEATRELPTMDAVDAAPSPAVQSITAQAKIAAGAPDVTFDDLLSQSRKFNLDLAPKLLFGRGQFVETLINANITHYADFRTANRILTFLNDEIINVPCSRSDVFGSTFVSVIEKRMLMKFLTFCLTYQAQPVEFESHVGSSLEEFLKSKKLTEKLQFFVTTAIAMVPRNINAIKGLDAIQRFLQSLGRYSNSPFLWPMYGVGELPQAFCRMSAVFGGIFCLRKSVRTITSTNDDGPKFTVVCSNGEKLKAEFIVMNRSYVPPELISTANAFVSHAIVITNRSLKESEEEHVTLLTLETEGSPAIVIEAGPGSCACPRGLFVVNLFCEGKGTAEQDLMGYVERLFDISGRLNQDGSKPCALWCIFFSQECSSPSLTCRYEGLPENLLVTNCPDASLGIDHVIDEARTVFEIICPGEEFLPAVPNPEDIIWDDVREGVENQGGFGVESEQRSEEQDAKSDAINAECAGAAANEVKNQGEDKENHDVEISARGARGENVCDQKARLSPKE